MTGVHLACAADEAYIPHSAAMLHSALVNGGGPIVFHYLHGPGFPDRVKRALAGMCEGHGSTLCFYEIAERAVRNLPSDARFGPAMWYRIFLPKLLPDVERVLYLDVDTLVLDTLTPLWELALDGYLIAAVQNVFMKYHRWQAADLGLSVQDYFNSGVLLFHLEEMRKAKFTRGLSRLVRKWGPALKWPDQDALNLAAQSRWLRLHPRWNVMNSYISHPEIAAEVFSAGDLAGALSNPAIRHFEGPEANKPWHSGHDAQGQELYASHRLGTPWPEVVLVGSAPNG